MIWPSKLAVEIAGCVQLLIIREDLIEAALSVLVAIISVATLEALELGLESGQSRTRNL
jgi:hypothetical protein